MCTWISDIRVLALAAPLVLSGCLDGLAIAAKDAPEVTRVASGSVAIAGPRGYCIDPVGTRDRGDAAFVLLGSCAALNGTSRGDHPDRLAVLTASVMGEAGGPAVADASDELAAAFASEDGRALLSRSGDAATVQLLDARTQNGILFLHIRDSSPFEGAAVDEDYWRAVMDVDGRMVMLSVIPLRMPALEALAARGLLETFVGRILQENRGPAPSQPPAPALPSAEIREAARAEPPLSGVA